MKTISAFRWPALYLGWLLVLPFAAQGEQKLPPGKPLIAGDPIASFHPGPSRSEQAVFEIVPVVDQSFAQAIRAQTRRRPRWSYGIQARLPTTEPVERGDTLLLRFHARAVELQAATGEALVGVVFERASAPHTKSVELDVTLGTEWKEFGFPFRAAETYSAGQAQLNFRLGYDPQTVEIGGVELVHFGSELAVSALPSTRLGYRGEEPDAPWRAAAQERIERYRKGDLTVRVANQDGQPIPGATVSVEMQRHAFGFGSAVAARFIAGQETEDARRYKETILRLYNRVVFENDLKWHHWENHANRELTLKAVRWLREHGIEIRGHCLVWPSWNYLPRDLRNLKDDPAALRRRVNEHILDEAGALRGMLVDWDVINEPYTNHDLMDILGNDAMVEWFKLARQADPDVRLYINDYNILSAGGMERPHQDHYEQTIRFLIENGAPLDGIGMQGHFGQTLTPPERLIEILDRFAVFGKDIQVTEHDINITDEQLQADYTRDFMTAVFSHPSVTGILNWGFWEGRHWRPTAAYFRRDWSVKPAGEVWTDLVHHKWWTRARGEACAAGEYRTRGFLGDYKVTVASREKQETLLTSLPREGRIVTVTLELD